MEEYPYFDCKKKKILLENKGLSNTDESIVPPDDMLDSSFVYWMDLYLTAATQKGGSK